jgi:hypothetical protein
MASDDDSPKKPGESVAGLAKRVRATDELRTARILEATNPMKGIVDAANPMKGVVESIKQHERLLETVMRPRRELDLFLQPARDLQERLRPPDITPLAVAAQRALDREKAKDEDKDVLASLAVKGTGIAGSVTSSDALLAQVQADLDSKAESWSEATKALAEAEQRAAAAESQVEKLKTSLDDAQNHTVERFRIESENLRHLQTLESNERIAFMQAGVTRDVAEVETRRAKEVEELRRASAKEVEEARRITATEVEQIKGAVAKGVQDAQGKTAIDVEGIKGGVAQAVQLLQAKSARDVEKEKSKTAKYVALFGPGGVGVIIGGLLVTALLKWCG